MIHTADGRYVRHVCCKCETVIPLFSGYQINGVASCYSCHTDHQISYNVLPRPYKKPRSRKWTDRTGQDLTFDEWTKLHKIQEWVGPGSMPSIVDPPSVYTGGVTTVAFTEEFSKDPCGGL